MESNIYENLADFLSNKPGSIPVVNCPEFVALLEALFSPEEAELASKLPFEKATLEKIADSAGSSAEEALSLLDSMADKGLVFYMDHRGERKYKLMDVLPGFFEFQFMKGESSPRDIELSRLFQAFFDKMSESTKNIPEPFKKITPISRIINIDREISPGTVIHPYETISEYIDKAEYISVSFCYCRHHGELIGKPCDYTKEVCLGFGPNARFIDERGFGRLISKDEAYAILKKSEEEGLVHISSNTTKYIEFICNCCTCHCGLLQSVINSDAPQMAALSNFELVIDEDNCIGCEDCVDICPTSALNMEDRIVQLDKSRCIGCGVCNVACSTQALSMTRKADSTEPPYDMKALGGSIMKSIQDAMGKMKEQA